MTAAREIESYLFELAPHDLAQSWDNVGLLVGRTEAAVQKVLVALDITGEVVREAAERGCDLIVAHHPVMNCAWHPVQSVRDDDLQGRLLMDLLQKQIAAICMHTNLDAARGGVNDALAAALGLVDAAPAEKDGIERIGTLPSPVPLERFLPHVKERLGANGLRYADGGKSVCRVAVGGGACGDFFAQAAALGCDTFVTADVKYNQFLDAAEMGINLIDAGHFPTEDVVCPVLVEALRSRFPDLAVVKSQQHREVIQYFA